MTMENTTRMMLNLLRTEVCDWVLAPEEIAKYTPERCVEILELSQKHDLAHLSADALLKYKLSSGEEGQLLRKTAAAVYRYERMNRAAKRIFQAFEEAGIPFLPLKGYVIREKYPEPWMRTSCDIDILVHHEMLDLAENVLAGTLGYRLIEQGYHNNTFCTPDGIHIELHFTLLEKTRFPKSDAVVEAVWDYASPVRQGSMQLKMSDEMYYFYHILHMACHFCEGGCGVRPLLDLWLLDHKVDHNQNERNELLSAGGLLTFTESVRKLSYVWFSDAMHTELTRNMEAYILRGGTYGIAENKAAMWQVRKKGTLGVMLSKIFLPYDLMKVYYPILQKHKWLLPFGQAARWCRVLRRGHWRKSLSTVKAGAAVTGEVYSATEDLLTQLGL